MINGKSILVTGGTGSFGRTFCETILKRYSPERLIVYSRDEFKQTEMMHDPKFKHSSMRFFLGDVRDKERLTRAMSHVDIVIHTAALKQVPVAEYNPHEFIKTNIEGAMNVVEASLNADVEKVIALSTDKAVNPINLYGATKLCSDKIFVAANSYRGRQRTEFSVVRYGNVVGSRGSVIPRFLRERATGKLSITHPDMTRFYITLEQSVDFVLQSLGVMVGGEVFVPKIPSCTLRDLAQAIAPDAEHDIIGLRPGEKMHEMLIPEDEAHLCLEYNDYFAIQPLLSFWDKKKAAPKGKSCEPGFSYSSDKNSENYTIDEIRKLCSATAQELNIKFESPEYATCQ